MCLWSKFSAKLSAAFLSLPSDKRGFQKSARQIPVVIFLVLLCATTARAEGFILGVGADADSIDGRAISAFGDFGVGEKTWLSATVSTFETNNVFGGMRTKFADAGIDHWFKPFGIRLGASYWGNSDILDSVDLGTSVYFRGDKFILSADYKNREFDFVILSDFPDLRRKVAFSADGWGLTGRFSLSDSVSLHLGGMQFDYSRNIRIQQDIDSLRFLSSSRLSMINSLLDHRVSAGLEFKFGLRSIDLTAGSWQTAGDGGKVNSFSLGFLTPLSDRTDIEFRFSFDDSENFGNTTALSVYLYYFGGS